MIQENQDAGGNPLMGGFVVTVDDGSGYPSQTLLSTIQTAVEAVPSCWLGLHNSTAGSHCRRRHADIDVDRKFDSCPNLNGRRDTLTGFINSMPVGSSLPISRISQLAYAVSSAIINVTQVQLNGATVDIVPPSNGVVKVGQITVN